MTLSDQKSNRRHSMNLSKVNGISKTYGAAYYLSGTFGLPEAKQKIFGELTDLGRCRE